MATSKANMRLALEAFKGCKKYLLKSNVPKYNQCLYICHALDRSATHTGEYTAAQIAKKIVLRSIKPDHTFDSWSVRNGHGETFMQQRRHMFVDACIAELKRRLGE